MIHGCRAILTGESGGDLARWGSKLGATRTKLLGYFRHIKTLFLKHASWLRSVKLVGWRTRSLGDGNTHSQSDAAQHTIAGADSSGRNQHGPQASVLGGMCRSGSESARVRNSRVAGFAHRNTRAAERAARRRKRFRPGCELSATGEGCDIFPDRSVVVQRGKYVGNRRTATGLELHLKFRHCLVGQRREDGEE